MEKRNSGKLGSLKGRHRRKSNSDAHKFHDSDVADASDSVDDLDESLLDLDQHQILADIDTLVDELSTANDKWTTPDVPETVETFFRIIELRIKRYNSLKSGTRFGKTTEDDTFFIDAVRRLSRLKIVLGEFPNTPSFNRTNKVLNQAMMLMEDEFRALLRDYKAPSEPVITSKASDGSLVTTSDSMTEEEFPGYSEENVVLMIKITNAMIPAGYQYECCQVYSTQRKNGLHEQVKRFQFEKANVEDVQRSKWASLEPEISRWIKLANHCSNVLFPAERRLGETVFSNHLSVFRGLFINLLRSTMTMLLEFATAVATLKRKAKRLFKFLEIYEALRDLGIAADDSSLDEENLEQSCDLKSEISSASHSIGEGIVSMFTDLQNSIRNDANKTPVQRGAVHPLTRYVMSYLQYACEYGDTLEIIFRQHENQLPSSGDAEGSPFSKQLLNVMEVLDTNLETKSTLYKDLALRHIFLMNNGRYTLQIVKGTDEMREIVSEKWCRRKSSDVRNYHKNYQRETWAKLLQCITQEGVQVNGKPNRRVLKERFKNFNAMFDEIHKTQSTWVISDEQLLSEIRISISAVVIPAYRSFVGRYKPQFEGGKSIDKYIKYQPEDLEALIETLFEGFEKVENQVNALQAASTMKQTAGAFKNLLKTYKSVGLM